jgi:hypothetical protein
MRILILCWFDVPTESIDLVCTRLKDLGHEVRCLGTIAHPDLENIVTEYLRTTAVDKILVWNRSISKSVLEAIRRTSETEMCLFNWDDPHSVRTGEILPNAQYFDKVFSCCREVEDNYLNAGAKAFQYLVPCFGSYHFPEHDPKFVCDVGFACTNLYKNFSTVRYELCQKLRDSDIDFHLYGPARIREEFPDNYKGYVQYHSSRRLFSSAKLSLSTHVENGLGYLNERDIDILASGGILLTDKVNGMEDELSDEQGRVYIELNEDPIPHIRELLKNIDQYAHLRERGRRLAEEKFSVERWVSTVFGV